MPGASRSELERRLEEAENAVRALLAGQADAVLERAEDGTVRLREVQPPLRGSEAHTRWLAAELAEAQRIAHVGSWQWNVRADRMTWSDELYRIFGREPGSPPPSLAAMLEHVHVDDRDRVKAGLAGVLARPQPFRLDYRIRRADGSVRHLAVLGTTRTGADGSPQTVVGTCHDVTEWVEAHAEISTLNAGLEQRAAEHTAQLESAYRALAESEARFRMLADAAPVFIWLAGPDGAVSYFSQPWLVFTGRPPEHDLGFGWLEAVHPADRERCRAAVAGAVAARQDLREEFRLRRADGEYRWILAHGAPRFEADGRWAGLIGSALDITDRKLAEAAVRLLAEIGHVLAGPLDDTERLHAVAQLMVPRLADWCALYLAADDQNAPVWVAHAGSAHAGLAEIAPQPGVPGWSPPASLARVLELGEPQIHPSVSDDDLRDWATSDAHWQALRDLGIRSAMVVPLITRGRVLGALSLVRAGVADEAVRPFTAADAGLAQEVAHRVALLVDNTRLDAAERLAREAAALAARRAEVAAQQAGLNADRTARLQSVTVQLSKALTPEQVTEAIGTQIVSVTHAAAGAVLLLGESAEHLELASYIGYPDGLVTVLGHLSLWSGWPVAEAARTGRSLWFDSLAAYRQRFPEAAAAREQHHYEAALVAPLLFEGRSLGAIMLSFHEVRGFDEAEREFVLTLARQCAQALERARLFAAERRARAEAQRLNAELEQRVAYRTAELQLANARLEQSQAMLRQLSSHLQATREDERARIAREIHDELGQQLTGLKMDVAWIRRHLHPEQSADMVRKIYSMSRLIDTTIRNVRRISTELRPGILDDLGLVPALEWQLQEFGARTGLAGSLQTEVEGVNLSAEAATAVFRIFQETLANIARHAQAQRVDVRLFVDGADLVLQVRDDGVGLSEAELAKRDSFGVLDMRERAYLLRGDFQIEGQPGRGTTVTARLPLDFAK